MDQRRADAPESSRTYELDTVTLRDMAVIRYMRHHEWLDRVVGSTKPTKSIVKPSIQWPGTLEDLDSACEALSKDVIELTSEVKKSTQLSTEEKRAIQLKNEIENLRSTFGEPVLLDEVTARVERLLGKKIVPFKSIESVPITYNRQKEEAAQNLQSQPPDEPMVGF